MQNNRLRGVFTALATPFKDGKIAFDELQAHVEMQIDAGVDGLVPVGSTGESPTLSPDEHVSVIKAVVDAAAKRVPVIAGTGANSTVEAVHFTKSAEKAGADAFLQVSPYYNKPSQEGQFQHFSAVAEVTEKPIVLYSIPGRCVVDISIDTVARLYEKYPHVNTIKEAGGSTERVMQLYSTFGNDICILSGDDGLTLPFMAAGAEGVISVASNLFPATMCSLVNAALDGDFEAAREIHYENYELFVNLFIETNPVAIKYALYKAGVIGSPEVRLPLTALSDASRLVLDDTLKHFEIG